MNGIVPEDVVWLILGLAGAAAQAIGFFLSTGQGPWDGHEKRIAIVWGGGFAVALLARAVPRFADVGLPLRLFESRGAALAVALAILAAPVLVRGLRKAA